MRDTGCSPVWPQRVLAVLGLRCVHDVHQPRQSQHSEADPSKHFR